MTAFEKEERAIRTAVREAQGSLREAVQRLNAVLRDEGIRSETPLKAVTAMASAVEFIAVALRSLEGTLPEKEPTASAPGGPTRQQGQFLAYLREYMMRNESGVAPSHADFMRFFNLTAPLVNSMLERLESRGFIRRIPRKARAIELTIDPGLIPALDRRFKY